MTVDRTKLQYLWQQLTTGEVLSEADEQAANALLKCEEPFAQFVGKLTKAHRGRANYTELFLLLEEECSLGFERSRRYAHQILFMLGDFPMEKLGGSKPIRSFTFAAVLSTASKAKINAVHVLAALASCKDKEANSLLEQMRADKALDVRLTASYYCSQIRESGKVTRIF